MKLTYLLLTCSLGAAIAGDPQLRIVRQNKPVNVEDSGRFATNIIRFFESASVDATSHSGGEPAWHEVLGSDSYVHLTFTTPRTFRVPVMTQRVQKREERPVNEILVSLPEGRYPVIRVRSGTNYMAVTKWRPEALQPLVKEPALQLSTVKPYDHFYKLKVPTP